MVSEEAEQHPNNDADAGADEDVDEPSSIAAAAKTETETSIGAEREEIEPADGAANENENAAEEAGTGTGTGTGSATTKQKRKSPAGEGESELKEAPNEETETGEPTAASNESKADDPSTAVASTSTKSAAATSAPVPRRPVKRSRTAYFIFADEVRPGLQKQHPGEGVAAQAKRIGAKWQSASVEEKDRFKALALHEKEALTRALEAYKEYYGEDSLDETHGTGTAGESNGNGNGDLVFPVARIRKIAKLDPEVKQLSKEALQLVVKSAELALAKLGKEAVNVARIQNRRTLLCDDVSHVCSHREVFRFLKDDIQDLATALAKQKELAAKEKNGLGIGGGIGSSSKKEAARVAAAAGSKPLTSYFGAAAVSSNKS